MKLKTSIFIVLLIVNCSISVLAATELVDATPETVAGATTVDAAMAKQLFDDEAAFIDLRKDPAWNAGRIPGAIHLDFKKAFNQEALSNEVSKDEPVVFYCSGVRCPRSTKASEMAVGWGYTRVYYFRGGFPAWQQAGYPIE
jgi:rhodanese-related sulfurtransferase